VQVPLTLMRPSGQPGPLPTVLFAYGAYGVPLDPAYTPFRQSLLDRGVAFAIAHVRGGGDLGAAWHEAGRRLSKPSAVADYLAVARYLTEHGWAPPGRLVARSQSAGAAVVGAAVNQAPGLFAVTVLETPFLDCLRTLLDEDAPLTSTGWNEWGDPRTDPAARAMLTALSPLHNIRPGPYPALLLTAGEQDTRISAAEPLRFAAAVRAAAPGGDVLVRVSDVGHLGHSATTADHQDEADVLAFILDRLGLAAQAGRPARNPGGRP
jgi:oligopeptidase B